MEPQINQHQVSKPHVWDSKDLNRTMDIRLACVEDGLDNIGFRKFAAFVKSIHPNTKVTYIPTGNVRSFIRIMSEKGAENLNKKDIYKISKFLAQGDLVGLSSMT